jgi:hypothetical protein
VAASKRKAKAFSDDDNMCPCALLCLCLPMCDYVRLPMCRPLWPRSNVFVWDTSGPGLGRLPQRQRDQLEEMVGWQREQMHTVHKLLRAVLDAAAATSAAATPAAAPAAAASGRSRQPQPQQQVDAEVEADGSASLHHHHHDQLRQLAIAHACLAELHPGQEGREVALVLCSVHLRDIIATHHRASASSNGSGNGVSSHGGAVSYMEELSVNFTAAEVEQLAVCFAPLERLLKHQRRRQQHQEEEECRQHVVGFLGPPTAYVYDRLPAEAGRLLAPGCLDGLLRQLMLIEADDASSPDHRNRRSSSGSSDGGHITEEPQKQQPRL